MDLKRLTQVSGLLTATGTPTYVRVSAADGAKFYIGAVVNLTSTGPNNAGLQISDIKGHVTTTDVDLYLIDPATEAPFNATGYTVANSATITAPTQTLWVGFGEDGVVKDVFTDSQMQAILLAVLPGGATAASNVAVTNWPASQPVSLLTCPLPTNAATETTLGSILTKLNTSVAVTGAFWQATQPISAVVLPLPTGAATESTLSTISGKLGTIGQQNMAGSASVVIASNQTAVPISAASLPLPTGAATQTTLANILSAVTGTLTASVTGSVSVSNFPATQPVSAVSLPLPTSAATSTIQTDGSQKTQVTNFPATQPVSAASLPLPTGAATAANQTNGLQKTDIVNHSVIDTNNSSTTPLPGGGSFNATGAGTYSVGFSSILGSMFTDVPGTLYFDESPDGIHWDDTTPHSAVPGSAITFGHTISSAWYRVRYVNGGTPQGVFRLQTLLNRNGISGEMVHISAPIVSKLHAQLTKSVITGLTPASEGNLYKEVMVDTNGALKIVQSNTAGAYGGLIAVQETIHSAFKVPFGINTRTCYHSAINAATVTWANSVASLNSGFNPAGSAIVGTREATRHSSGQGNIGRFAPVFDVGVTGNRQAVGLLSLMDGFGFGYNGTQFGILIRKGGVDTWIPQGTWNGDDKFDGTGPSQETLNPQYGSPMQIVMQGGYGATRFYIQSHMTGNYVLVHTYKYANTATVPVVLQPSLPVRAECVNTGGTTNVVLKIAALGGLYEGVKEVPSDDVRFSFSRLVTNVGVAGAHMFAVLNKTVNIFGGTNVNTINVHTDLLGIRCSSVGDAYIQLILNPTPTTPSWIDIDSNTSVCQTDIVGTYSGGVVLLTVPNTANTSSREPLVDYNVRLAPGDILQVRAVAESSTPDVRCSLSWHEEN